MPTTPNLGPTHVAPGQSAKPTTVNGMADGLDEAIAGLTEKDCSAGGTITLSLAEWSNMVLHLTGAPSAGFNVVVPTNKKIYIVDNASGQTARRRRRKPRSATSSGQGAPTRGPRQVA